MSKKVSIIIPAYNEEKHIASCLESLSNLNYPEDDIEIIVVDNGSTDRTREIARGYGVKVLRDNTLNVSGLRNLGVAKSTGEIIAFVDADCVVSKEWLNNAAIYFENLTIVAWGGPPVPPKDSSWVQKTWFLIVKKNNFVEDVNWLGTVSLFVRKEQFLAISGFNESLITCEDVDFSYRIGKYGKIVLDNRIEYVHQREASTVLEFIKKEIWRGRSNLKGVFSHGLALKEIPSLCIPLYFGVFLPAFLFASIMFLNLKWFIMWVFLYILPTLGVILKVRAKKIRPGEMLRLLLLIQVYFFSRTIAIVKRK